MIITPAKPHRRKRARKPARTLGAPHPSAARPRARAQRCVLRIGRAALGCGAPGGRNHDQGRARVRKSILNLNHPALVAARKAAIDAERARMERDFKGKTATPEERETRAASLLTRKTLDTFVSIRICWIRKRLGKGR